MKKFIAFLFSALFLTSLNAQIKIYHGKNSTSTIIDNDTEYTIKADPGETIKIKIINPNPHYYDYTFSLDSSKVEIENPNFEELASLIVPQFNVPQSSTKARAIAKNILDENEGIINIDKYSELFKILNDINTKLKELNGFIKKSDDTNPLPFSVSNFSVMKDKVEKLEELKLSDKFGEMEKNIKLNQVMIKTLKSHAELLLKEYNTKRKNFIAHNDIIEYKVKVKENQKLIISLTVTKRGEKGGRDIKEKLITIEINPNYKRKSFELVPMASLIYGGAVNDYGISNNLITEKEKDGFKFDPGFIFNYNVDEFGKYNRNALGLGIGVAISEEGKNLDNLFGNVMLSFTENFRISLGAGYAQYPVGLKNSNSVGNSISGDFNKIDDVVEFDKTFAVFFSFSIFGLDIPFSK